jgi:hypothetical protein
MKKSQIQMGIEIKTKSGAILRPHQIQFWDLSCPATHSAIPKHFTGSTPHHPFKYFTDAILGLCYHRMNDFKFLAPEDKKFATQAYNSFDPYSTLFSKSAPRVKSLRKEMKNPFGKYEAFEKKMSAVWEKAFAQPTVHFADLNAALECLSEFEHSLDVPFLYNFSIQFSDKFNEKLICFYSFLFHLRALVALDHNAHVDDSSFESIKCDSISDYLPKSDYTINDALLYWQFQKLSIPFVGHKDKDTRIEKLFVDPMLKSFNQYNHNACCLIDQLPKTFLNSLSPNELEEALHHVQMDWLLGSEAGMLFKIREELYGIAEGYDKIFWHEVSASSAKKATSLNISFNLNEKDLSKEFVAA